MKRRDILNMLKALPLAAAAAPALALKAHAAAAPRAKITDIKLTKVKLVKHIGMYTNHFHLPTEPVPVDIGNFTMTEVFTDQGAIGIGPASNAATVKIAKEYLVGKDPFDVVDHSRYLNIQSNRSGVQIETAIWDLCGKLANQPLWKLWGGGKDKVMPYGATDGIGDGVPAERARTAAAVKALGFKAVKMRASFPTMKQDVEMMTLVREAIGPDMYLLVDANKAGPYGNSQLTTIWDYQRAYETAQEFQKLNTYWLEEPLGRWDYDAIAEIHKSLTTMHLAGGEINTKIDEYVQYMQKNCYDILNLDVTVLGPTLYRQAMDLAFAFGKRVTPHGGGLLGGVCHMHLAAIHPQPVWGRLDKEGPHLELAQNPPLQNTVFESWQVFTNAPKLDKDGFLPMPLEPGLGVSIIPDLIQRT